MMPYIDLPDDNYLEDNRDDGYVTEERARRMFISGAQYMREMLARFVEQGGDKVIAQSIRLNWVPSWGDDPGQIPAEQSIIQDPWDA